MPLSKPIVAASRLQTHRRPTPSGRRCRLRDRISRRSPDHKIILIPAAPDYRPRERELWPLVNQAIMQCLRPHPKLFEAVQTAARAVNPG